MAYKKFIKRGGKIFGPYYYESYRDQNGAVKKKYLGTVDPDMGEKKVTPTKNEVFKKVFLVPIVILSVVIFGLMIFNQVDSGIPSPIYKNWLGHAIVEESFENVKDFFSGSFFKIAGLVISDSEESGEAVSEEDSGGGEDEVDNSDSAEETEEAVEEAGESVEEEAEVIDDSGESQAGGSGESEQVEEPEEELEDEGVVESLEEDLDEPDEEAAEEFDETLTNETVVDEFADNETVEEINETSEVNETIIEENETFIEEVVVNETFVNETFVNETLTNETILNETFIDETPINETVVNETLVNETLVNETIIEINETLINETVVNETFVNESVLNETEVASAVESLTTLQYKAVIHRPVKWMKKINVSIVENLTIEIPKLAENVSVLTDEEIEVAEQEIDDYESLVSEMDKEEIVSGFLTGNVVIDINSGKGFFTKLWDWILSFRISGNVVLEDELEAGGVIVETAESKIVDVERIVNETDAKEVAVEYWTPAPVVVEQNISGGKLVTISADDVYNYTDVLAYSLVGEMGISVDSSDGLKVYWRASYDDAVRYGYIEETPLGVPQDIGGNVSEEDLNETKEEKEELNEIKEEKEKKDLNESLMNESEMGESVEDEIIVEAPIGHDPAGPENETFIDEIVINETIELNESEFEGGEKVKEKEAKDNETGGKEINDEENETRESSEEKKLLITGEVVGNVSEGEVADVGENETVEAPNGYDPAGPGYVRVAVNFSVYDFDGDGFADYVEWIVPHLSNQTYEVIIEITKAEHLDENRIFISDVYDEVKALDGNWSEVINDGEYVRVTFESVLDYTRDITVYARSSCANGNGFVIINETEIPCDVYLMKKRIDEIMEELR